ncbi:transglutaminaseTgpA domain-containing protein [Shouchella sp. 1P09AA]|uniref:transglutaminase TgpA family protein n=1 Tax=unclassified Shouchella TaxID=2893065 RepID=UPI0039A207CD
MNHNNHALRDYFLYGLGFILLLEWLYPVPYITSGGGVTAFIVIAAVFFIVTLLRLPIILSFLLRVVVTVGALFWLFPSSQGAQESWFSLVAQDFFDNIVYILAGNVLELSELFRTFLFIVLLSILSYLLHYWIVHVRKILLFLIVSVVYVGAIDSFTEYSGEASIVRLFIIGMLLVVTLRLLKNGEKNGNFSFAKLGKVMAFISVFILTAASLSFVMPKPEPQWSDPVPFLESVFGFASGGTPIQRIGYSEDDSMLGGGFVQDDTPVFEATMEQGEYWKGETKNVYTGSGWDLSVDETNEGHVSPPIQPDELEPVEREEKEAQLQFYGEGEQRFNHFFYPGELLSNEIENVHTEQVEPVVIHPVSNQATFLNGQAPPNQYELAYFEQTFQIAALKEDEEGFSGLEMDAYTQLPEALPDRVQELAEEITATSETVYDQVRAIEQYLRGPEFQYETEDVPVPSANQDYVDQFLFETQRGYCDNFSTAMAVMLRTLDIPTRWVKGFTEGELIESNEDNQSFLISNNNAHSWVEVYFPSAGWVSFEPTPSFTGFNFEQEQLDLENNDLEEIPTPEEQEDFELPEEEAQIEEAEEGTNDEAASNDGQSYGWLIGTSVGLFIVFGTLVFVFRKRLSTSYVNRKQRSAQSVEDYAQSFERLLWLLRLYGVKRTENQTIREYAQYVEKELALHDRPMVQLAATYEQFLYSDNKEQLNKQKFDENWKKMLNQITS